METNSVYHNSSLCFFLAVDRDTDMLILMSQNPPKLEF